MMKRIGALVLLACPILMFGVQVIDVQAQEQSCDYASQLFDPNGVDFITPISGATMNVVQTVTEHKVNDIENVIVYGQDKEEEGVSLTVTVQSAPGKIQHDEAAFPPRPERVVVLLLVEVSLK